MAKDNSSVFFIIPVYNEVKVIGDVVRKVRKVYPNVVCIDDGSRDNSAREITKAGAYLVQHPINMGQGAALQTGIEFARSFPEAKYFVMFDADGQHRLEDATSMIKVLETEDVDIVVGSRFLGTAVNMPKIKRAVLKAAIVFSNVTSGIKLTDTHNGLRAFNRHVAENMQITMSDMAHASEILEIIRSKKFKYKEIPVKIIYTDYSKSKGQSIFNAVNIAFDILLKRVSK